MIELAGVALRASVSYSSTWNSCIEGCHDTVCTAVRAGSQRTATSQRQIRSLVARSAVGLHGHGWQRGRCRKTPAHRSGNEGAPWNGLVLLFHGHAGWQELYRAGDLRL